MRYFRSRLRAETEASAGEAWPYGSKSRRYLARPALAGEYSRQATTGFDLRINLETARTLALLFAPADAMSNNDPFLLGMDFWFSTDQQIRCAA
jgi:hypothetical protein